MTIIYRYELTDGTHVEIESRRPINVRVFHNSESNRTELDRVPTEDALTAEQAIARLKETYDLIHVSYDDGLTDEQVDLLVSGDNEGFWDALAQFEMENRDGGVQYVIEDEFSTEEWESLSDEDQEEVRFAIEERDDSNWTEQLIKQTSNPLLRINVVDEDNAWSFQEVEPQEVLDKIGLEATAHNIEVIQTALNECSPEYSVLMGYWIVSVDLHTLYREGDKFRITNPYLFLGNPFAGSGWLTDKALEGTVVVERENIHTDKGAFGYSVDEIHGGLRPRDFEAQIELVTNQTATN